jgi:hypothetical protein
MRRIGTDFQVNALTAGPETSSQVMAFSDYGDSVPAYPDGTFGVVYDYQNGNTDWLEVQVVNKDGTIFPGSSYLLATSPGVDIATDSVSASDDPYGAVSAVYDTNLKISVASMTEDGVSLRNGVLIDDSGQGPFLPTEDYDPDVAYPSLGNPYPEPIVVFERVGQITSGPLAGNWTHQTVVDIFGINWSRTFSDVVIEADLDFEFTTPRVAAGVSNLFVVLAHAGNIYGKFFGYTASYGNVDATLADFTSVPIADHPEDLFQPDVAYLGHNEYVVVYHNATDIFKQLWFVTSSKTIIPGVERVVSQGGNAAADPHVAALANGGFVVTWDDTGVDGSGRGILERIFSSNGRPVGSQFLVNQLTDGDQVKPSVAVSGTNILTTWTDFGAHGTDSQPPGIRGQVISVTVPGDSNGDGKSDLLFQNTDGTPAIWLMNGTIQIGGGSLGNPGPSWHEVSTGDFNNDGRSDILWQNDSGEVAVWEMNGTSVIGSGSLGNPGRGWHAITTGDFNADGPADILWQNDSGEVAVWEMNGTSVIGSGSLGNPGPTWHVVGSGDYNGDGYSDIRFQNGSGEAYIWELNGTSLIASGSLGNPGPSWHLGADSTPWRAGDVDLLWQSDVTASILWQNDSGEAAVWEMNGTSLIGGGSLGNPGPTWHVKGTGNFLGNGRSDILWQNSDGTPAIWEMNGTSVIGGGSLGNPGPGWHIMGSGDYNNDGRSDILWQNSSGEVAVWEMSGTSVIGGGSLGNPGPTWHV